MWDKINLMVPTFRRSETHLPEFIKSVLDTASPNTTVMTFLVNVTDPASEKKIDELIGHTEFSYDVMHEGSTRPNLAKFWNKMYDESPYSNDPAIMVSMIGDDMMFKTAGWDATVLKWCNIFDGVCVIFGDDCTVQRDALMVNAFTTQKFIKAQSPHPFMCEEFPIDYMDKVLDYTAKNLNRRLYVDNVKIFHNHSSLPGNSDDTYRRLRTRRSEADKKEGRVEEYAEARAERIRRSLQSDLQHEDISVMMTTCDRVDILRHTVASYGMSEGIPDVLYVFDDCSIDLDVYEMFDDIDGVIITENKKRLGHNLNTPTAMKTLFESGTNAVFVLDSDTRFCKHWWEALNCAYRKMQKLKNFGVLSLMNSSGTESYKTEHLGFVRKTEIGAFGTLYTKEFFYKYVWPQVQKHPNQPWDVRSSGRASADKVVNYATSPSFLQHVGTSVGAHGGGGNDAYATDFGSDRSPLVMFYENKEHGSTKRKLGGDAESVLVAGCGRFGDIIHASMYVNQMINDMRLAVYWITIPYYRHTVSAVCPDAKLKLYGESPEMFWYSTDTYQMSKDFPGYDAYVNAQPGAPQHHGSLMDSGIMITDYLRNHFEECLGREFNKNLKRYLVLDDKTTYWSKWNRDKGAKPLCIIAPGAISAKTMWGNEELVAFYNKYSKDYDVRLIYHKIPDNTARVLRRAAITRITFPQAIGIIKDAALFIGQDSGLAWASLYSDCKKIIYHRKSRMVRVLTRFSEIDPSIEEVVVDNL